MFEKKLHISTKIGKILALFNTEERIVPFSLVMNTWRYQNPYAAINVISELIKAWLISVAIKDSNFIKLTD